jgi:GDP-L-fucose synthase
MSEAAGAGFLAGKRIYVAGHRGLAGSAIVRALRAAGHADVVTHTRAEADLEDPAQTRRMLLADRPQVVFLAAAKVGGIHANNSLPVDFLLKNLLIEANVIRAAHEAGVERLIFLGSSCIYPREAPVPIKESSLLTGPLEATNRPYALAKIAGIEMCWAFNRQYGSRYLAAMPTNLYGIGDNYDPEHSHVFAALIRKVHEAKAAGRDEVVLWGSGKPRREFLSSDDLARGLLFLADLDDARYTALTDPAHCPLINVGTGEDLEVGELAALIADVIGWRGRFVHDTRKPDGTMRKVMDVSRIRTLGWAPSVSLREGIAVAYRDFLSRHP